MTRGLKRGRGIGEPARKTGRTEAPVKLVVGADYTGSARRDRLRLRSTHETRRASRRRRSPRSRPCPTRKAARAALTGGRSGHEAPPGVIASPPPVRAGDSPPLFPSNGRQTKSDRNSRFISVNYENIAHPSGLPARFRVKWETRYDHSHNRTPTPGDIVTPRPTSLPTDHASTPKSMVRIVAPRRKSFA